MDHPAGMRVVEAVGDGSQDADRLPGLQGPGRDQRREGLTGDVLHHDQHAVRAGDRVVHGDDVGVVEPGPELSLALEALRARLRSRGMQPLHRNLPGQHQVLREEDGCHPSVAEAIDDAIAVSDHQPGPDLGRRPSHPR